MPRSSTNRLRAECTELVQVGAEDDERRAGRSRARGAVRWISAWALQRPRRAWARPGSRTAPRSTRARARAKSNFCWLPPDSSQREPARRPAPGSTGSRGGAWLRYAADHGRPKQQAEPTVVAEQHVVGQGRVEEQEALVVAVSHHERASRLALERRRAPASRLTGEQLEELALAVALDAGDVPGSLPGRSSKTRRASEPPSAQLLLRYQHGRPRRHRLGCGAGGVSLTRVLGEDRPCAIGRQLSPPDRPGSIKRCIMHFFAPGQHHDAVGVTRHLAEAMRDHDHARTCRNQRRATMAVERLGLVRQQYRGGLVEHEHSSELHRSSARSSSIFWRCPTSSCARPARRAARRCRAPSRARAELACAMTRGAAARAKPSRQAAPCSPRRRARGRARGAARPSTRPRRAQPTAGERPRHRAGPSSSTWPWSGASNPTIILSSVVLPAPLAPHTATSSPAASSRST